MGIFRKKFGLEEAGRVVKADPNIAKEHVKAGVAFVGALNIPVTVVAEAETQIAELTKSAGTLEEEVRSAREELNVVIPARLKAAVATLKEELDVLLAAIRSAISARIVGIEDRRDGRIRYLAKEVETLRERAGVEADNARAKGERKISAIEKEINKKIAKVESQQNAELNLLQYEVSYLTCELDTAKRKIDKFSKIKDLFA